MTDPKVPKNSSVWWAAFSVAAVIIGYVVGISSVPRNSITGENTFMMMIYADGMSYEDIDSWSNGLSGIEVTGSGVFPSSGTSNPDSKPPSAFVIFKANSLEEASEIIKTFPKYDQGATIRQIKAQE